MADAYADGEGKKPDFANLFYGTLDKAATALGMAAGADLVDALSSEGLDSERTQEALKRYEPVLKSIRQAAEAAGLDPASMVYEMFTKQFGSGVIQGQPEPVAAITAPEPATPEAAVEEIGAKEAGRKFTGEKFSVSDYLKELDFTFGSIVEVRKHINAKLKKKKDHPLHQYAKRKCGEFTINDCEEAYELTLKLAAEKGYAPKGMEIPKPKKKKPGRKSGYMSPEKALKELGLGPSDAKKAGRYVTSVLKTQKDHPLWEHARSWSLGVQVEYVDSARDLLLGLAEDKGYTPTREPEPVRKTRIMDRLNPEGLPFMVYKLGGRGNSRALKHIKTLLDGESELSECFEAKGKSHVIVPGRKNRAKRLITAALLESDFIGTRIRVALGTKYDTEPKDKEPGEAVKDVVDTIGIVEISKKLGMDITELSGYADLLKKVEINPGEYRSDAPSILEVAIRQRKEQQTTEESPALRQPEDR
ncbi:MAG: hypothetical protein ISS48_00315 [Candidatus Aenigmarchaeota archaeon]|nr:hypothetical protein [Candidatus Aenigmarchaeota archaeon]